MKQKENRNKVNEPESSENQCKSNKTSDNSPEEKYQNDENKPTLTVYSNMEDLNTRTITKRVLGSTKAADKYLNKWEDTLQSGIRNDFSGLDGPCSRTFIRNSYKVSGLLISNSKQIPDSSSRKSSQNLNNWSVKVKSSLNTGKNIEASQKNEHSSDTKARARYMDRKKQFEKTKGHHKHNLLLSKEASVPSISMSHRKAMSYFKSQKNSTDPI